MKAKVECKETGETNANKFARLTGEGVNITVTRKRNEESFVPGATYDVEILRAGDEGPVPDAPPVDEPQK